MSVKIEIYFDIRPSSFRKRSNDYPYKLRIYSDGVPKLYQTIYGLTKDDHDKLTAKNISPRLREVRDKLKDIEEKASQFIKNMDLFTFEDFTRDFIKDNLHFDQTRIKSTPLLPSQKETDLTEFHKKFPILLEKPSPGTIGEIYAVIIKEKLEEGKESGKSGPIKTARNYQSAYTSLVRFGGNVLFKTVTSDYLKKYARWMKEHTDDVKKKKCSKTTIGIYARTLMTVFNRAIRLKIIKKENCYPFGQQEFSIPGTQNIKKVFSEETIEKIYYYDDSKLLPRWRKPLRKARSFWFFMYFGQGMNPKDVALLKFKNIHGEHIIFERAKTEDTMGDETPQICVYITSDMQATINEFANPHKLPENYLFPIFQPEMTALRQVDVLEYFIKFINKWIQFILDKLGIDETAGCQVARGSYATRLAEAGASLLEIGQDLGHKKPSTTARYVGSLPLSKKKINANRLEAFKRQNNDEAA